MSKQAKSQRGQASVELALAIPLLTLLFLLLTQVGVVLFSQLAVTQSAREAARAAAVDPSPGAAVAAARRATRLNPASLSVKVGKRPAADGMVHVAVSYPVRITLPFAGQALFTATVNSDAAMRVEVPR